MKNLNQMETFILVVETGSFTRAAKARGISKAAASKQIVQLENEMGVALLNRSTRNFALTDEGKFIYDECRKIVDNVAEIEAMLSELKAEPSGVLSVISGPVFGQKYILPYLKEFIQRYPKINLKLNFRYLMPNMLEEKVDVVVGVFGSPSIDTIQKTVVKTRRILCASPAYLQGKETPQRPKDLFDHILMIHPDYPDDVTIQLKMDKKIKLIPRIISNDQLTLKRYVLEGMGIAYLHRHVVEDDLLSGRLIEILEDYMEKENTILINLYYLQKRHLPAKIRCFIDFISDNLLFQ